MKNNQLIQVLIQAPLRLARTLSAAAAVAVIGLVGFASDAHANSDCFTLPNGVKFCTPERVSEMAQCVRRMERDPNAKPAEHCRRQIVGSCRNMSDRDFQTEFDVQRPRLIDARANERTRGWNKFCPVGLYKYSRLSQGAIRPAPARPGKEAQARRAAISEFGGDAFIVGRFDTHRIPVLKGSGGPCLCNDNSRPVFGFCSGRSGTYKPECAKE